MTDARLLEVLPQIRLSLTLQVPLSEYRDFDDRAVSRWFAEATVPMAALAEYEPDKAAPGWLAGEFDEQQPPAAKAVALSLAPNWPDPQLVVATFDGLSIDLDASEQLFTVLDESHEHAQFISLLHPLGSGALHADLDEHVDLLGSTLVIVDSVELAPAWRGLGGVGQLLTGRVLQSLIRDARLVATRPFPRQFAGLGPDPRLAPARAKVEQVAAGLGFFAWRDGLWCLSPHLAVHGQLMAALDQRFGLTR